MLSEKVDSMSKTALRWVWCVACGCVCVVCMYAVCVWSVCVVGVKGGPRGGMALLCTRTSNCKRHLLDV